MKDARISPLIAAISVLMLIAFVAGQFSERHASAQNGDSFSGGGAVDPGYILDGRLRIGRDDVTAADAHFYGDLATQGAKLSLHNSAGEDGTYDAFVFEARNDKLHLTGGLDVTDNYYINGVPISVGGGGGPDLAADEVITGNWVNTTNPWADNEVSDDLTINGYMQDTDIDTFAELQAWVPDKTLLNLEDNLPWTNDQVSDTLTASIFHGTGSLTDAVDLSTAEVSGTLPGGSVDISGYLPWTDPDVADTLTIGASSTVADGALSSQVAHLNAAETITANWVNIANPWADNEVSDTLTIDATGSVNTAAVPWATPGTIGSTTPNTGAFTTLSTTGNATLGGTTGARQIFVRGAAGNSRVLQFNSGATVRWQMGANSTAESGSDAGSDFVFNRYNDAGVYQGSPLAIFRSSGNVLMNNDLTISGNDLNFNGASAANIFLAQEQTLNLQSQASVMVNIDSDNDGASAFTIRENGSTDIFDVNEGGQVDMTGSVTWNAANSYNLANSTNRLEDIYADDVRLGSNDAVEGTMYVYGSSGYDGGIVRIYNGHDGADATVDYWDIQGGDGAGAGHLNINANGSQLIEVRTNGDIYPAVDKTQDLGGDSLRWERIFADTTNTNAMVVSTRFDFVSGADEVTSGGALTPTSPEPRITHAGGATGNVTSVLGSSGWYAIRAQSGYTITFVDDDADLDLQANRVLDHPNDVLMLMNIGSDQFIEMYYANNQ